MDDIYAILERGEAQKRRAATAMNDRSTRAHSLFILTLKQSYTSPDAPTPTPSEDGAEIPRVTIQSRLFLADLGGSEQVKKSQVEAGVTRVQGDDNQFSVGFQMGDNMREAVYINLGLLALKKCIENLNHSLSYVPFKDSKLTMLLSEGLGGNSKTSVIICANMLPVHATETVATLRFGERCALVETSARNNATILENILAKLDEQIAFFEAEILRKERWEVKEEFRSDELAEEGTLEQAMGGKEVRKVTFLVGAEEERKRLGELLLQRAQFTGSMSSYLEEVEVPQTDDVVSADAANATATGKGAAKVLGFGKQYAEMYGLGEKYETSLEENLQITRFEHSVAMDALPTVLRSQPNKQKAAAWATGEQIAEMDTAKLSNNATKAKRSKLAYSAISF
jgi:kinesin family protein 5